MLQATKFPFAGTAWKWLTDPDALDANELIDPFDLAIYKVLPSVDGTAAPTLDRTDETYEPDHSDAKAFQAIHQQALGQAIAALPHNGRIVAGNTKTVFPDASAKMAKLFDLAMPVAAIGSNVTAGTGGVGPCVALLARVPVGNRLRVGCIHLSANDMSTLKLAADSLNRLLTEMSKISPDPNTGPVELYAIGGSQDNGIAYEEFSRVIAAAQIRQAAQPVVPVHLVGALVPASLDGQYVDVHIGATGVTYSINQR
ncbi:hypothetical protein SAMN05443287_103311 [Micromonospora phaseoli]|uniref:Uncharacterized protein n=1 Tax=Micromonospora phaseoli TaxID=1144548 RepID=A0A1H6WW95_9ACTN|nr:hypothetical protein [Micromonospora phaseoli]PZW01941.1 hypothetical protein CLV64_102310 [Micromonospora phaseoli]GIJ80925.1 hypothetical protein Xph01_53570 [Micromonospora phaseoli]SEJ20136.1 hypothetical protein SAMN05443287_103311 [Micromonospora phaseoli]